MVWHVHVDIVNWASSPDGVAASISAIGGMENKHVPRPMKVYPSSFPRDHSRYDWIYGALFYSIRVKFEIGLPAADGSWSLDAPCVVYKILCHARPQ